MSARSLSQAILNHALSASVPVRRVFFSPRAATAASERGPARRALLASTAFGLNKQLSLREETAV